MIAFITNMEEFEAARDQVIEYVESGRRDDDVRIEQLVTEMEMFSLRCEWPETETLH